jgi:hypothetical protein
VQPTVVNNHIISRMLTKRWELPGRQLAFYDFELRAVDRQSSRNLLARPDIWSKELETFLNTAIETPVGRFLVDCDDLPEGAVVEETDRKVSDPLTELLLTLAPRFGAAYGADDARQLLERSPSDDLTMRVLLKVTRRSLFRIYRKRLPARFSLFFPSTGGWFLPFGIPALALSLSPTTLVVMAHREVPDEVVRSILRRSRLLVGLSVGKSQFTSKVIIPPSMLAGVDAEAKLGGTIARQRERNIRVLA